MKGRTTFVKQRLMEFFRNNQSEELSFADIEAKLGCSHTGARQAVRRLVEMGELEDVRVVRLRSKGIAS